MNIKIYYESVNFRLRNWKNIKKLIAKVISEEKNFSGDLNFIIVNDKFLKQINKQFLKHNYYTDVISFNYQLEENNLGEIYISTETVKRNCKNYKVSYTDELLRVMIHGTLHLCGMNDSTEESKELMHLREDYWIKIFRERNNGF